MWSDSLAARTTLGTQRHEKKPLLGQFWTVRYALRAENRSGLKESAGFKNNVHSNKRRDDEQNILGRAVRV
jgi:hypothetical protein